MTLYQRRILSPASDVGEPAALPADLVGLPDDVLADLSAHLDPAAAEELGYAGQGFFPIEPEPPTPAGQWIHKLVFMQRFTLAERAAIRAARGANVVVDDFLYLLEQAERVNLEDATLGQGLAYLVSQALLEADRPGEILA